MCTGRSVSGEGIAASEKMRRGWLTSDGAGLSLIEASSSKGML
jgi:hypothetical protein